MALSAGKRRTALKYKCMSNIMYSAKTSVNKYTGKAFYNNKNTNFITKYTNASTVKHKYRTVPLKASAQHTKTPYI